MPSENTEFEALLGYLKQARGFDFTAYKRASLMRRVEKRMELVGVGGFTGYLHFLEEHPDEFIALFNTILINVTSFFRDPDAWEFLQTEVLPPLVTKRSSEVPLRIWSAGCASGEEAYSVAMAVAELIGVEATRDEVKIYATDADEQALSEARQAIYPARRLSGLSDELRAKYFEPLGDRWAFNRDLRRSVIFGRHDLLQDAPISRIDLLLCRNAMMYFNVEAQKRVLARFHFALRGGGTLFLGKSETLLNHPDLFSPIDLRRRFFCKIPGNGRDPLLSTAQSSGESTIQHLLNHSRLREAAADAVVIAQIVIDSHGVLTQANTSARQLFGLASRDLGRLLQDLEMSYRPVEVRSLVEKALAERRTQTVKDVNWPTLAGEARFIDVEVTPLFDISGNLLGTSISFHDVTLFRKLREELQSTNQELETTLEELQSSNEELETTNEELQSTNEELETTNEELQSSNEELETMNEELQSTNDELQSTNDEARDSGEQLNHLNSFLNSVLTSLRGGVIVLDAELQVTVWNRQSQELWGLREDEAQGQHLFNLDVGLPVEQLKTPVRACLTGETETAFLRFQASNRRGKPISCHATIVPLRGVGASAPIRGVILVTEEIGVLEGLEESV